MADPPMPPPVDHAVPAPPAPAGPAPPAPPVPASPVLTPEWPAPQALAAPQAHVGYQLNWSHFRPEFAGKPEEDVEAHLLCTKGLDEYT